MPRATLLVAVLAICLTTAGAVQSSHRQSLRPPVADSLLAQVTSTTVQIQVPAGSNHSCDLVYVKKTGGTAGYTHSCYTANECRYSYVIGNSQACIPYMGEDVQTLQYVSIPNVEQLADGKYATYFARWGAWDAPSFAGREFEVESGVIEAKDDPHVTNMDGQKFDIYQTGNHTLVRMPRGSEGSDIMFDVVGLITRAPSKNASFAKRCWNTWITKIWMAGGWLEDTGPLEFFTGPGDFASPGTVMMRVGNNPVCTPESCARYVPHIMMQVITPRKALKRPARINQKVVTRKAKIRIGPVGILIRWAQTLSKDGPTNHLDIETQHLSYALVEVGGILGHDSHAFAATKPKECRTSKAAFMDTGEMESWPSISTIHAVMG